MFNMLERYQALLIFRALLCVLCKDVHSAVDSINMKGHLQPFGESGTRLDVETADRFPHPNDFLTNFVQQSKPLKLTGVAKDTRAFRLWTDSYLLSLELPEGDAGLVHLETMKKENRTQETLQMNFHVFLKVYNDTEYYMVDDVPEYLRADIVVPCSLQCPQLLDEKLAFVLMWFSSGGTKSVVHTDSFDNINCVFRGEKTFIMVDPALHREKVDLNNEGSHSDIDVDSVDLTKYPKLAEVEFYHINLTAGDCLYIPYRWIHQVRSYNSNVAVNFWWNHYASLRLLETDLSCPDTCDPNLTLKDVQLHGEGVAFEDRESMRDWLVNYLVETDVLMHDRFVKLFADEFGGELDDTARAVVNLMFDQLDINGDGKFTLEEAKETADQVWKQVSRDMNVLVAMLEDQVPRTLQEGEDFTDADTQAKDEL